MYFVNDMNSKFEISDKTNNTAWASEAQVTAIGSYSSSTLKYLGHLFNVRSEKPHIRTAYKKLTSKKGEINFIRRDTENESCSGVSLPSNMLITYFYISENF